MGKFKEDWLPGLKNIAIALLVALVTVGIGTSSYPGWLFLALPAMTGGAAYLISKNWTNVIGWGVLGLLAALGFYLAI